MSLIYERMMEKKEEERASEALRILDVMEKESSKNPKLKDIYQSVRRNILTYYRVLASQKEKIEKGEVIRAQESEESDAVRRAAHNGLLANLNRLERVSVENRKNNSWYEHLAPEGHLDRGAVMDWVEKIGPSLEIEEELKQKSAR